MRATCRSLRYTEKTDRTSDEKARLASTPTESAVILMRIGIAQTREGRVVVETSKSGAPVVEAIHKVGYLASIRGVALGESPRLASQNGNL